MSLFLKPFPHHDDAAEKQTRSAQMVPSQCPTAASMARKVLLCGFPPPVKTLGALWQCLDFSLILMLEQWLGNASRGSVQNHPQ